MCVTCVPSQRSKRVRDDDFFCGRTYVKRPRARPSACVRSYARIHVKYITLRVYLGEDRTLDAHAAFYVNWRFGADNANKRHNETRRVLYVKYTCTNSILIGTPRKTVRLVWIVCVCVELRLCVFLSLFGGCRRRQRWWQMNHRTY